MATLIVTYAVAFAAIGAYAASVAISTRRAVQRLHRLEAGADAPMSNRTHAQAAA